MSTRSTIKYREQDGDAPGFHLYEDAFEVRDVGGLAPVYLDIVGVDAELSTLGSGGGLVSLALPRELARALGILSQEQQ
jgi:hypothetical protein